MRKGEAEGAGVARCPPVSLRVVGGVVVVARAELGVPVDGVVRVSPSPGPAGGLAVEVAPGVRGGWGYMLEPMA